MEERSNIYITSHSEEYCRKVEGARTAVLLLHCMFGSPKYFNDYIDLIPENWSIHSLLLKGHGGTAREYGKANMSEWKKQVNDEFSRLREEYDYIYLVGHSLGTLFAITLANANPDKVKGLFLLSPPMKPILTPRMVKTAFQLLVFRNTEKDMIAHMAKEKYSIRLTKNYFLYLGFIHNYVTLFQEIFEVRKHIHELKVPCWSVFSRHDELVFLSAKKYFEKVAYAKNIVLENSYHFYYERDDYKKLRRQFQAFCREMQEGKNS